MNWHLRTLYLHASCRDPWGGNSQYHSSANGVQPTILSGPILGGSQPDNGAVCTHKNPRTHIPQLGRKPSSQDTKGDKKGMAVPERKQVNNQSVPDSKFTSHHSIQTKSYKCICLPIESGKKGMTWSFPFLPPPGTTISESWLREFSPSAGFSQFPQHPAGSGASGVSQGSHPGQENLRRRGNNFSSKLYSECWPETPFSLRYLLKS